MSVEHRIARRQWHPNSIVKFRGRRAWSVKDLAECAGMDEWTVRMLEKGHINLHDERIKLLCHALHCTKAQLLAPCHASRNAGVKRKKSNRNLEQGRGADRWAGRLTIPKHADPLVRELFKLMNKKRAMITDIAKKSGICRGAISDWRYRRTPNIANFQAALGALGYELTVRRKDDEQDKM